MAVANIILALFLFCSSESRLVWYSPIPAIVFFWNAKNTILSNLVNKYSGVLYLITTTKREAKCNSGHFRILKNTSCIQKRYNTSLSQNIEAVMTHTFWISLSNRTHLYLWQNLVQFFLWIWRQTSSLMVSDCRRRNTRGVTSVFISFMSYIYASKVVYKNQCPYKRE